MLPEVRDCAAEFGTAAVRHLGRALPVRGIAGDQQAALIGQACFRPGMVKATFGTGAFVLLNTGTEPVRSTHRLLTTVAYQLDGTRTYALEGSIFSAGATVQWLRDGLHLVRSSAETGDLAADSDPDQPVYLVPAFVGLGAPHWDAEARGTITGLTRGSGRREIARAALESTAFQTRDLVDAMRADETARRRGRGDPRRWRHERQRLHHAERRRHDRRARRSPGRAGDDGAGRRLPRGAAVGLFPAPDEFARMWKLERRFAPMMAPERRDAKLRGWRDAVARTTLPRPA